VAGLAIALPALYTPNLVGGLGGQLAASSYPAAWSTVASAMNGPGKMLLLPWHEYQVQPFTGGRVVASLTQDFFDRGVVQDDFAGVGYSFGAESPSTAFVDALVQYGSSISKAGVFLAQLGVRWVVLDKTADWQTYAWLAHQTDLRLVLNKNDIELFENTSPITSAARVTSLNEVPTLDGILSSDSVTSGHAYVVDGHASDPRTNVSYLPTSVRSQSTVELSVGPGQPGWLVTTIPYEAGWQLDNNAAIPLATGNLAVRIGRGASILRFTRFTSTVLAELMSLLAFLTCAAFAVIGSWRRRNGRHTR
jgi:hypothetical protein